VDSSNSKARVVDLGGLVDFGDPMVSGPLRDIRRHPDYESLVERVKAEGREEGRRQEAERSAAELQALRNDLLGRLETLLGGIAAERRGFLVENREEALRLALAVARRVTSVQLAAGEESLLARLGECLDELGKESSYLLRLNPEDRQALDRLREGGAEFFGDTPFRILPDARVERGGLVLEGSEGRVESICGESLDRMERELVQWQREREEEHASDPR